MIMKKLTRLKQIGKYLLLAFKHGLSLKIHQNHTKNIKDKDIILFAVMKNEAHRLPFFIDYYRELGVNHFIFVDNGSTDHFNDVVKKQSDITSFYTEASYKESNFGMHWANYLLFKYGQNHWCMTCDPDEFIVYPYMDNRDLRDLTDYLDSTRTESFFTVMLDMYADKAVEDSYYKEGTNPLSTCPYFDGNGFSKQYNADFNNYYIQGGVRRRVFYKDNPLAAPALNKLPLVKWKWSFSYISSMHMIVPNRLNQGLENRKTSGALLHYKFISQLTDKIKEEQIAQQHYDNSSEYKKYEDAIKSKTLLYNLSVSTEYKDWKTVAKLGLINKGEW